MVRWRGERERERDPDLDKPDWGTSESEGENARRSPKLEGEARPCERPSANTPAPPAGDNTMTEGADQEIANNEIKNKDWEKLGRKGEEDEEHRGHQRAPTDTPPPPDNEYEEVQVEPEGDEHGSMSGSLESGHKRLPQPAVPQHPRRGPWWRLQHTQPMRTTTATTTSTTASPASTSTLPTIGGTTQQQPRSQHHQPSGMQHVREYPARSLPPPQKSKKRSREPFETPWAPRTTKEDEWGVTDSRIPSTPRPRKGTPRPRKAQDRRNDRPPLPRKRRYEQSMGVETTTATATAASSSTTSRENLTSQIKRVATHPWSRPTRS